MAVGDSSPGRSSPGSGVGTQSHPEEAAEVTL